MDQKKHMFPLKTALRAQRLIQGSVFYGAFTDLAVGQYVRIVENPEVTIKKLMLDAGMSDKNYEVSWNCFVEYMNEFQHPIYQYGIFSMVSHWDWYISQIGKFVSFARSSLKYSPTKNDKVLLKINRKPFKDQLEILAEMSDISFVFSRNSEYLIEEMNLVRNLGMHNLWEVDEDYLAKSVNKNWEVGQKRKVLIEEINSWHFALLDIVTVTSNSIALQYVNAPIYK